MDSSKRIRASRTRQGRDGQASIACTRDTATARPVRPRTDWAPTRSIGVHFRVPDALEYPTSVFERLQLNRVDQGKSEVLGHW